MKKKFMSFVIAFVILVLALSVFAPAIVARADGVTPPGQGQAAIVGAQCGTGASSGAFGYFAHGYIQAHYSTTRGADGVQTGLNNSAVCGNRQGNLP